MQSFFNLETEVAHRRSEWEREIVAVAQRAQVRPENGRMRCAQLALQALAHLRSLAALRLPVPKWNPAGVQCATTLEGGRATAT